MFNKIATTFIYLDIEVQKIKEIVKKKKKINFISLKNIFFLQFDNKLNASIMLYGEHPEQDTPEMELKEGQGEIEFSRILGVFKAMYD